jgi:hypothetical protein
MPRSPRVVIVGGVAGGASAAARARRLSEEASIVLFERGPYVSFANCGLPYHIGGMIEERSRLLIQTPESLYARFDIDVRVNTEAVSIEHEAQVVVARNLKTGREIREPYDALVLSPGAKAILPAIPGAQDEGIFTLRNMGDMDAILAAVAIVDTPTFSPPNGNPPWAAPSPPPWPGPQRWPPSKGMVGSARSAWSVTPGPTRTAKQWDSPIRIAPRASGGPRRGGPGRRQHGGQRRRDDL